MKDKNEIQLVGTVFNEPRCSITATNLSLARLVVCVHRPSPSKVLDFINVTAWNDVANEVKNTLHDGDRISLSGTLQKQKYLSQDGTEKFNYRVVASHVEKVANEPELTIEPSPQVEFAA